MYIRFMLIWLFILFFASILVLLNPPSIPDRYPQGHDLGHGCVAIELGGFPYKLCPINP